MCNRFLRLKVPTLLQMVCISILLFGKVVNKFDDILPILKKVVIFPEYWLILYCQNRYGSHRCRNRVGRPGHCWEFYSRSFVAELMDHSVYSTLWWRESTGLWINVSGPGPEYQKMEYRDTLRWFCCCRKHETLVCQKGDTLSLTD